MKCEGELINMTRAWDKEKFGVPDSNRTHDLPNTGQALYPLSYKNSWRARSFKVDEHSFRVRFCWCNSARAQGLQKQTCRQQSDHFIYSTPALSALFFSIIERSILMALVFYYKDMLEKVTTQKTQQFSAFSLLLKEPS